MTQHSYDRATALALMELAYPNCKNVQHAPYAIRDDGVYPNEAVREVCPPGSIFDWTPADEMDWPGCPNPDTAPFLPIPFNAAQLAAAMIDGPGQSIAIAMDRRLGYPLEADALHRFSARMRWMRDALAGAYAAAAAAQTVVGEFDHNKEADAYTMACQFDDESGQANEREGVFEPGITRDEANARRGRAVASVAHLETRVWRVQSEVANKWKPLTGAYIKRHALKGISSAADRQLSTSVRRGK